jgi:hypothetical protein
LSRELCGLERKTARSGRDSIDHVPGGHDDLANSVAGVLVGLDLDRRPPLVDLKDVTGGGETIDAPWCQYVFLTIIDAGADIAAVFCGSTRDDHERGVRHKLHILDIDAVFLRPGLFGDLIDQLALLGRTAPVKVVWAPEHLCPQIPGGAAARVEPLPPEFKPELWLAFASDAIGRGLVRFCAPVVAKMQTQVIAAALALKAGDPVETALRSALIASIWLKHGSG